MSFSIRHSPCSIVDAHSSVRSCSLILRFRLPGALLARFEDVCGMEGGAMQQTVLRGALGEGVAPFR
jgi:hypothetical protein